jgi:hypothetical protein
LHRGEDVDEAAKKLVEDPDSFPSDCTTPCLVGVVTEGGFFGDLGWVKKTPRVATYEAQNICQMLSISRHDIEDANHQYSLSGKNFSVEINRRYEVFADSMAASTIISDEGGICKSELFMDGVLVSAHNIKFSASGLNMSLRSIHFTPKSAGQNPSPGGIQSQQSGIKRMNSSELLTGRAGRRSSTPSINIDDLDSSNHKRESPSPNSYARRKSFKTRRNSTVGPIPGIPGSETPQIEEKVSREP